jgi:hypothetical protein
VIERLVPRDPSEFHGYRWVRWVVVPFLAIVVIRSLLHLLLPDGGADSIAGVDTSGAAGANVVAMFGQWGAIQLLLVFLLIILFIRYPGLTSLVILTLAMDAPLRALAGELKPLTSTHTPPGATLNWPFFVILIGLLAVSLVRRRSPATADE